MDLNKIGANIAYLRKCSGYTQDTLAEKLNISPQAISKWERGMSLPEASLLIELSALFKIPIDDILMPSSDHRSIWRFFNRNFGAPSSKVLTSVPRISRWDPPEGCDMFYSMPAMIANALCCIEAYEDGREGSVSVAELNDRFCELLHVMGIGYSFLWEDDRHVIEELWRMNPYDVMADNVMRYYGRDYLWLTNENTAPDDIRKAIVQSIDRNHPVVMEEAGGCPEFSIVTGYEKDGNVLIGYTYCEECAATVNEHGMFVNPARWDEVCDWNVLIIGDKEEPTYSFKDSLNFAVRTLTQGDPQHREYKAFKFTSGDDAIEKWLADSDTPEKVNATFICDNMYSYALHMNTIYTQTCLSRYFKKLSVSQNKQASDIIVQIGIAIDRLVSDRARVDALAGKPEEFLAAARNHIENLLAHRKYMRGWLEDLSKLV